MDKPSYQVQEGQSFDITLKVEQSDQKYLDGEIIVSVLTSTMEDNTASEKILPTLTLTAHTNVIWYIVFHFYVGAGKDYVFLQINVTFSSNLTSHTINIQTLSDEEVEGGEIFSIALSSSAPNVFLDPVFTPVSIEDTTCS